MFINRKERCPPTVLFYVPHKPDPVTAHYIEKKFPSFAKDMDGVGSERCLTYFWTRNKTTKIYEFIDEEAEEEVAEILGVEIYDEEKEKEKAKKKKEENSRALTEQEIKDFKEELTFVRDELTKFKNKTTSSSSEESDSEQEQ